GRGRVPRRLRGLPDALESAAGRLLAGFFFKQKTAYEIGLGIPAEPLFRSESPERKTSFIEISRGGKLPYKTGSPAISVQVKAPLALRYSITVVAVAGKRTSARVNIVPCSGTKKRGTESI